MKLLLKLSSYLFHPIWMPFAGALLYFLSSPRFFPVPVIKAKILAISILTIFIPYVFFLLLRTLGKTTTHFLTDVRERRYPLLFNSLAYLLTLKLVLDKFDYPELYFYFLGILISTLFAYALVFLKIKLSLHMMGLGGLISFLMLMSVHFHLNLIFTISFLIAVTGLTASSRLFYKAHTTNELAIGILSGALPQFLLAWYWL